MPGSKTVFYMRGVNRARLFFRYSPTEKNLVEILAESNKSEEAKVIKNLLQNYE